MITQESVLSLVGLISPLVLLTTAIISWFQPGIRPTILKNVAVMATYLNVLISGGCCIIVFHFGTLESSLIGLNQIGFSIRLDSISVIMLSMIALLSFIIVKFSLNYLDGEKRQGAFLGRMAVTIACVQLFVMSGNIGLLMISWILTSTSLHRLLLFYPDRHGAVIVARKKFLVARLADICLLTACIFLYVTFKTGNLEIIFNGIKNNTAVSFQLSEVIALFLILAALIKSAQFPTHSWLIEVMETPTPVSALLHAGLLNAGPFLIIRMSPIIDLSTYSSLLLITIGGFTALFASIVFLTQPSIKTALGYSSVAHMGFSLFTCGLGAYSAAMLHLMAHSFYKAHAFLSSGSTIDLKRGLKIISLERIGSIKKILLGIMSAFIAYTGCALLWRINIKEDFALFVIGMVLILGLSRMFASAFDSKNSLLLMWRAILMVLVITNSFFMLEWAMHYVIAGQLPPISRFTMIEMLLTGIVLCAYATAVVVQIFSPYLHHSGSYQNWTVHLKNGFYVNALFDLLVGTFRIKME